MARSRVPRRASRPIPKPRVEFRGATVTSDAGLLLPRELDERLGLSALIPGNAHSADGWDEVLLPIGEAAQ